MLQATIKKPASDKRHTLKAGNGQVPASLEALQAENVRLRDAVARLRLENDRLWRANHDLRAALDARLARARSTALFGPVELTAGTCVGPRPQPRSK